MRGSRLERDNKLVKRESAELRVCQAVLSLPYKQQRR